MSEQPIQTPCAFGENGNFLLERELGVGGMGGVYMGRDKMLDRPVAVKVMSPELGSDAEFVEKFKKEAQSAARLVHPNIAQVYSYGFCQGRPYMAMELAAGGSLYSIMNAAPGKTDVSRVIKLGQQVAQALRCAADQGCVHGDVKPENILLDANGNAKLVDFGLAGMQKETNEIWGTPYYISPEKVKKEPVDFRADMYSLGGTLYHALTGTAPFEGDDAIAVVKKRLDGNLPRKPSEIRPELTPAIDNLLLKMLAFQKENRYPSFEALLEAFQDVLTSGLTSDTPASPAPKKTVVASGAKRGATVLRGRRLASLKKRPGATLRKPTPTDEPKDDAALDETEKPTSTDGNEEEEEGGNLGLKVLCFVVGGILLLAAVAGGLWWMTVSSEKSRRAAEQAQIVAGIDKARTASREITAKAIAFADEFETFAARATTFCQKTTDELKKIVPEDQVAALKPPLSQELLEAIASTNASSQAAASAPATTNNVTTTATNGVPSTAAGVGAAPAAPPPAATATPESHAESNQTSQAVIAMNELWTRAYGCQAAAIRVRQAVRQLVVKSAEAETIRGETLDDMENLAGLTRTLADMFDRVKGSKDVENVKKGIAYIKSKGEKTVELTAKQMRLEKIERDRKEKAAAVAAAEKARLEKAEAEHKAKIEEESAAARERFSTIVSQGSIRQLDWRSATRQLNQLKAEMTTAEGQLAVDVELRKVNNMKKLHDIFLKNLKGHVFKGVLKGARVAAVNEKEISLVKADGKSTMKVTWQKFYRDYPGNLNEIINLYVVNTRHFSSPYKLNLRDWAEAMTGAALTMQLVCSEVNGAVDRAAFLVKKVVKHFPDYLPIAQATFPDMKLELPKE